MNRREFIYGVNGGLGALAFHSMLRAEETKGPLVPKVAHFPQAKAKRCIFLYMAGGPSQLELFDYKPKLQQMDGKVIPSSYVENKRFAFIKKDAKLLGTRRQFLRWGDSGQQISSLLPHLGSIADDVAIACAAIPSPRPGKPSPSVVVALMLTRSGSIDNMAAILSRMD